MATTPALTTVLAREPGMVRRSARRSRSALVGRLELDRAHQPAGRRRPHRHDARAGDGRRAPPRRPPTRGPPRSAPRRCAERRPVGRPRRRPDASPQGWGAAATQAPPAGPPGGPGAAGPGSTGGSRPAAGGRLEPHAARGARGRRRTPPRDRRGRPLLRWRRRDRHRPHHDDGRHDRRHDHDDHRGRHDDHDRRRADVRVAHERRAQLHPPRRALGGLGGERTRRDLRAREHRGAVRRRAGERPVGRPVDRQPADRRPRAVDHLLGRGRSPGRRPGAHERARRQLLRHGRSHHDDPEHPGPDRRSPRGTSSTPSCRSARSGSRRPTRRWSSW